MLLRSNHTFLLALLLAVSVPCCTKKPVATVPELIALNATPSAFTVTLEAKFLRAENIKRASFSINPLGEGSIRKTATISGNTLTATFDSLRPNVRYRYSVSWATAKSEWTSPAYSFDTDPYPMPKVVYLKIEPGAYDAMARFRFQDEEYLRSYIAGCYIEGTGGAYNTSQSKTTKEGDEYVCTMTNLVPETFYEFHIIYSNKGAIGNTYSMRFKTLPPPYTVTVTDQEAEPSYFSAKLSASFEADVDYTPCGFMFREYMPVEWNVITITPVNNRIETEIPDLKPEKGYRFKVFYTVRGETFMTEEQSFGTPAVPVPEISSAHFNISGNSVILTADISQTEFVTQSGFILLDNISFDPAGRLHTWRETTIDVTPGEGRMSYEWEGLSPGIQYGFKAFGTNGYKRVESERIFFTIPGE